MTRSQQRARTAAGLCVFLSIIFAVLAPFYLPHYITDRELSRGVIVEIEVPLQKMNTNTNPARDPYEYFFTVDGLTYQGTEHLSQTAIINDSDSDAARARVAYRKDAPDYNRMIPVDTSGPIRWVGVFPWLIGISLFIGLIAWLIADWEHLQNLYRDKHELNHPQRIDLLIMLTNALYILVLISMVFSLMASLLALIRDYDSFYDGWHVPLLSIGVILGICLAVLTIVGKALDNSCQQDTPDNSADQIGSAHENISREH